MFVSFSVVRDRHHDDLVALIRQPARAANGTKKMERSRTFFSCVPEGRAQRATFSGCIMGNEDRSRGGSVELKRLRMFGTRRQQ
jgi:hypothetical protein